MPEKEKLLADIKAALLEVISPLTTTEAIMVVLLNPVIDKFFEENKVQAKNRSVKSTGKVRRIDDLGRVVIPKDVRRICNIAEGDPLEIFITDDGGVQLRKYVPYPEDKEEQNG